MADVFLAYFSGRDFSLDVDDRTALEPNPFGSDDDVVIVEDLEPTVIITPATLAKLRRDSARDIHEPWVRRPQNDPMRPKP